MSLSDWTREGLTVAGVFGRDDRVRVSAEATGWAYLDREDVAALRDHLTALLGDGFPPPPLARAGTLTLIPEPSPMSRADALKLAEETVTRLAPATNARGYGDGLAPLQDRINAILRTAAYLMKETP